MNILVPIDLSGSSATAVKAAVKLAGNNGAKLLFLHAITAEERAKECADSIYEIAKDACGQAVDYEIMVRKGNLKKLVDEIVNESRIELIVSGTRDEYNVSKLILGSTAAAIEEVAGCPVLIVPETTEACPFKRITFASNHHESDIAEIENLLALFRAFDPMVVVLHIAKESSSKTELRKHLAFVNLMREETGYENLAPLLLKDNDVQQRLKSYMEESTPDLLVMSAHVRSWFDKMFGESITSNLIRQLSVPLLAFHYKRESAVKLFDI